MRAIPKRILLLTGLAVAILCSSHSGEMLAANAYLTWNANSESDLGGYNVYYGTAPRSYGTPINVGNVATYTLTGLNPGTYYFAVTAYDTSGNESGFSNEASLTLSSTPDTTPPVISGVSSSAVSSAGATVSWTTNETSDTQIDYGTTTSYGSSTTLATSLVTSHSAVLSSLQASKLYHYRVKSRDAAGNLATSSDFTFTTLATGSGLVAAYSFNEDSGTTLSDSSGNSNTGTTLGATWVTAGEFGSALSFDGVNNYATIPNSPSLDISGTNLTISFWINIQTKNDGQDDVIINKPWFPNSWTPPYYQYGVEYGANGTKTLDFYFGDTSGTLRGPFSMAPSSLGTWIHVAFTYDGVAVKGYLNGLQKFSTPATQAIQARGNPLRFGIDASLAEPLAGQLDEVRIYNRALGQAEIQNDMNTPVSGAVLTRCDCNSDGATNALDLQAEVNAILAGSTSPGFDTNHDGVVNVLDLQVLGNVVLGVTTCPQ
jgi:hypothetical protein